MIDKKLEEMVLHTMKQIAHRERIHIEWVNGMLDTMCHELGIAIPERRNGDRRKNDNNT